MVNTNGPLNGRLIEENDLESDLKGTSSEYLKIILYILHDECYIKDLYYERPDSFFTIIYGYIYHTAKHINPSCEIYICIRLKWLGNPNLLLKRYPSFWPQISFSTKFSILYSLIRLREYVE